MMGWVCGGGLPPAPTLIVSVPVQVPLIEPGATVVEEELAEDSVAALLLDELDRDADGFELVDVIRPFLHHNFTLLEELRAVVRGAQRVRYRVRQLMLNHFRLMVQFFVKDGTRHRPEAVTGDLGARVIP